MHIFIPNVKMKTLTKSGHFASLDASENVANAVVDFITY